MKNIIFFNLYYSFRYEVKINMKMNCLNKENKLVIINILKNKGWELGFFKKNIFKNNNNL